MRSLSLNLTHLEHWERHHGRIPHGSFVILRSGWADYYQFHDKFFGYFSGEVNQMFPGKNVLNLILIFSIRTKLVLKANWRLIVQGNLFTIYSPPHDQFRPEL